jgi:hypothetical protein
MLPLNSQFDIKTQNYDTIKPVVLFPFHDPEGVYCVYLKLITPILKSIFDRAFLGIDPPTRETQTDILQELAHDPFFCLNFTKPGSQFGDHCLAACQAVVDSCPSTQVAHFCFIDRLAFGLSADFQAQFLNDINQTTLNRTPLLFQRSKKAWDTHPSNYRLIEEMVVQTSELVLKRALDLTWCHLAISAGQLGSILPWLKRRDLVMLGEMVLLMENKLSTQDVDWLAWEDPYILGRDPDQLKAEREASETETRKRLSYVIPTLQLLYEAIETSQ